MRKYIAFVVTAFLIFYHSCNAFDPFDPLPELKKAETVEKGGIIISVSWPFDDVILPDISGTMTDVNDIPFNLAFDIFGNTALYSRSDIVTGQYAIAIILKDGPATVWEGNDIVIIVKDQIVEYTLELNSSDIL